MQLSVHYRDLSPLLAISLEDQKYIKKVALLIYGHKITISAT